MCVAEVVFEGTGAAVLGGLLAAGVGVWGVRRQINAGRDSEVRREDVRVALLLMGRALALALALAEYVEHPMRGRSSVDPALIGLWTASSEASCRRPRDEAFRQWVREYQAALVSSVDDFVQNRGPKEYDAFVAWSNTLAQGLASNLESSKPLPAVARPVYSSGTRTTRR